MVKTCPLCGKKFANKTALRQHSTVSHVLMPKAISVPRRLKRRVNKNNSDQRSSSGSDILTTFRVRTGLLPGELLLNSKLGPASFPDSRLSAEATLWSRWKPTSLRVEVIASGALTTFGSIVLGWVADPSYHVGSGANAVSRIGALKHKMTIRLNETRHMTLPVVMARNWYDREGAPEVTAHGSIIAAVMSEPGGFTGNLSVTVELHWGVSFDGPELPFSDTPAENYLIPDSGWYNLFTTSDGSWNASYLTFKMHPGGDMAPFSSAQFNAVYTTKDTETKVAYLDANGAAASCEYFSRIKGYGHPGLVLHTSSANAQNYQKTGDTRYCISYKGESDFATPAVPQFKRLAITSIQESSDLVQDLSMKVDRLSIHLDKLLDRFEHMSLAFDQAKRVFSPTASFEDLG